MDDKNYWSGRNLIKGISAVRRQQFVRKILPGAAIEAKRLTFLASAPLLVDEIRNQSDLPIEKASASLAWMELKGRVRRVGGMNDVAVRAVQSEYRTDG